MKKELDYFNIGISYGGNQNWMRSIMMRRGGCGAITACDCSIIFAKNFKMKSACPFDTGEVSRKDYVDFAHKMEEYLWPRLMGIDRLEIFAEGYAKYLKDCGINCVNIRGLSGHSPYEEAEAALKKQTDAGFPVPLLLLKHKDRQFSDYYWHWFPLTGYETREDSLYIKTANYSRPHWMDFKKLWDTGYEKRGGIILFDIV